MFVGIIRNVYLCSMKYKTQGRITSFILLIAAWATGIIQLHAQGLPTDGPLTVRPALQQLGQKLLQGKTGSIVAIRPATGEIICLVTNSPKGFDVNLAIATPYAPGSTFKTAQALTLLSEGIVTPETSVECHNGITDGNIRVGCHQHRSPLQLRDALAFSCNTWFLINFASMINDDFMYESRDEAINTWRDYMRSMGMGGPLGVDIPGEKGGLLANATYLNRRYKDGWDGRTIWWAGMGQGDVTVTPLQLCNLAVTIANRGYYFTPHIHQSAGACHRRYENGRGKGYCLQAEDHLSHLRKDGYGGEPGQGPFCLHRLCTAGQSADCHCRLYRTRRLRRRCGSSDSLTHN